MKPQVLVRMYGGKEFFVVDEDTTTDELIAALLEMKNGQRIASGFLTKEWFHFVKKERTEVDYSAQSP